MVPNRSKIAPPARVRSGLPLRAGGPALRRAPWTLALLLLVALAWPTAAVAQNEQETGPELQLRIEGDRISLSVNENTGLPIVDFIKLAERITGRRFTFTATDFANTEANAINWIGTVQLQREEFYGFFQTMLYIKGFSCVPRGEGNTEIVELVNSAGPRRNEIQASARYVALEELETLKNQTGVQILTSVPLKALNAQNAANSLRPFFAASSSNNVIPGSVGDNRALILQGYAPQIYGLVQLLKIMDVAPEEPDIITRVMPIEYATAEELEPVLREVLVERQRRTQPAAGASGGTLTGNQAGELKVLAYPAQNALLLNGTEEQVVEAQELVARLDQPYETGGGGMHVIELQNVLADDLRETLNQFITEDLQAERQQQQGSAGAAGRQPRKTVVVAHQESNRLLISATQNNFRQLQNVIAELDQRQPQVLIEAALVELSTNRLKSFGIELAGVDLANGDFTRAFGLTSFGLSTFSDTDGDGFPDTRLPDFDNPLQGITGGIISSDDFAIPVLVNAVANDNDANILSIPSVVVNNNESAEVSTTEGRPTQNVTQGTATTQGGFQGFQDAGITLSISPTISSGNFLRLNISLEVSRFSTPFDPTSVTPGVRISRRVETQITLPSGNTMVLGGVLEDTVTEQDSGIPFLKDIPILGWLFRSYQDQKQKTNLYFFVTPTILDEDDFSDLSAVSFRKKLEASNYIGNRRLEIIDREWGQRSTGTLDGDDASLEAYNRMGGFEFVQYDSPSRTRDRTTLPAGTPIPTGPTDPNDGPAPNGMGGQPDDQEPTRR
jgi:general secretion pathway protein D